MARPRYHNPSTAEQPTSLRHACGAPNQSSGVMASFPVVDVHPGRSSARIQRPKADVHPRTLRALSPIKIKLCRMHRPAKPWTISQN
jgi:hypothetical protein